MGRLRHGVPMVVLLLTVGCAGCGDGSASFSQPPPPPAADFSLGFSTTSVSILQGATSPAINITVNGLNGFTGTVQITLSAFYKGESSIKGRVKGKNNPGDWKEQKRSPRSPAQVMLRGSGVFALRRSILFS